MLQQIGFYCTAIELYGMVSHIFTAIIISQCKKTNSVKGHHVYLQWWVMMKTEIQRDKDSQMAFVKVDNSPQKSSSEKRQESRPSHQIGTTMLPWKINQTKRQWFLTFTVRCWTAASCFVVLRGGTGRDPVWIQSLCFLNATFKFPQSKGAII